MTTLIAWCGIDSRGPASVYLAADSRISWPPSTATWDHARKLFACKTRPDILGYSGDVLAPSQTLSQIVDAIDHGLLLPVGADPEARLKAIREILEHAFLTYPAVRASTKIDVVYATREGTGVNCKFRIFHLAFRGREFQFANATNPAKQLDTSDVVLKLGSGVDDFASSFSIWKNSEVGGTSRAVYSAFCDSIQLSGSSHDSYTGGPPQLVGIYRQKGGRTFGTIWNEQPYFYGTAIPPDTLPQMNVEELQWFNETFERCDPNTGLRQEEAQPQPRPRNLEILSKKSKDTKSL